MEIEVIFDEQDNFECDFGEIVERIKEVEVIVPEYIEVDKKFADFLQNKPFSVMASEFGEITTLRENLFRDTGLESVELPDTITKIDKYVFYGCKNLTNIRIPDGVTSFGTGLFQECTNLKDVIIPSGLKSIGQNVFYHCESLASILLPDSVTTILSYAFYRCTSLKSVVIPNGVTDLSGMDMFSNCEAMESLVVGSGVTKIGNRTLAIGSSTNKATITMLPTTPPTIQSNTIGSNVEKIIIPKGCLTSYQTATNWSKYSSKMVEEDE